MKIYITGISGTGKTTIAKALNDKGIKAYDLDENNLCNWFNRSTGEIVDYEAKLDRKFIEAHKWVCNIDLLKNLIENEKDVVVLGNADDRDEVMKFFDKVLLLYCKPETFIQRIKERKDNDFGQDESALEYILDTCDKFQSDWIKKGAIPISVEEPLNIVLEKIVNEI